jgi:hypothetical protein
MSVEENKAIIRCYYESTGRKYIPLMTLPEAVELCKKAASLGYRPPGN